MKNRDPETNGAPNAAPQVNRVSTGVPGLDAILGGGLPEFSFNLIAGSPGAGKTTIAQQIAFANASVERPALFFTILGEPTIKMLRYQQQFEFFDTSMVGSAVRYVNLSEETVGGDLQTVLDRIAAEVEQVKPGVVVVDSFRTLTGAFGSDPDAEGLSLEHFVQRLGLLLTTWEVTSFLIGEYPDQEGNSPIFTVADGILWLSQMTDRFAVVRKVQVVKSRGHWSMPGLHTFRIGGAGLEVFPRLPVNTQKRRLLRSHRLSTGVPGLDELMDGGIPAGDVVMLAGPAGCGKTTIATQFLAAGSSAGETGVVVVFEEYPDEYLARAIARNAAFKKMVEEKKLKVIYLKPHDLSIDETLAEILASVKESKAARVVVDSLSGFEISLAPVFRENFKESLYQLVAALTATGATIVMTSEVALEHPEMHFTAKGVSFITDDLILQRFVEISGKLQKVLAVVKMRGSRHSYDFQTYELTNEGAVIGGPLRNYHGIITGIPELRPGLTRTGSAELNVVDAGVLEILNQLGEATHEELAVRTGLTADPLTAALERLESLGYLGSADGEGQKFTATTLHRPKGKGGR